MLQVPKRSNRRPEAHLQLRSATDPRSKAGDRPESSRDRSPHILGLRRRVVIRRDEIEAEILTGLNREVIREDLAAFALDEFKRQLQARLNDTRSGLSAVRVKREKLKSEIANLAGIIANGHQSAALLGELSKREAQLEAINDELLTADGTDSTLVSRKWKALYKSDCRIFAVCWMLTFLVRRPNWRSTARRLR